jgi:putative DNA primase/helicase
LTESLPKTLDTAYGLWREILPRFGVPATALNGKHQACAACGGKDRFRFTDRHGDGDYFCNGCGAGKGISLVAKVNDWDYPEAAKRIDEFLHRPYPNARKTA